MAATAEEEEPCFIQDHNHRIQNPQSQNTKSTITKYRIHNHKIQFTKYKMEWIFGATAKRRSLIVSKTTKSKITKYRIHNHKIQFTEYKMEGRRNLALKRRIILAWFSNNMDTRRIDSNTKQTVNCFHNQPQ